MTDELAISESHNYAFDMFTQAQSEVRKLNIPNKQAVIDLCQASMRMLASQLTDNDFAGAADTLNKIDAFEKYMRSIPRTYADYTWNVNKMADTHVRGLRMTGGELRKHIAPATKDGQPADQEIELIEPIIKERELESKYNIRYQTYQQWRQLSLIEEFKFNAFLAPYLDGGVDKGMVLFWWHVYTHFRPSSPSEPSTYAPSSLTGVARETYIKAKELNVLIQSWVQEIGKGHESRGNIVLVVDQLRPLPEAIVKAAKQVGEQY